jgi:CTP synthase
MFSNVPMKRVFSMHDRESVYTIPEAVRAACLDREVLSILGLHDRVNPVHEDRAREQWRFFINRLTSTRRFKARIGITGKYAALRDAYASIDKALEHCAARLSVDLSVDWIDTTQMTNGHELTEATDKLKHLNGVIVPGGFGMRGTEGKIACIRCCRQQNLPYLGICLGFQMAVIEFARQVCSIKGAGSTEFDQNVGKPVIDILPEQKKIEGLGGNMRLGGKDVQIKLGTLAAFLLEDEVKQTETANDRDHDPMLLIRRRFRHRFEVDPNYIDTLEAKGLIFSGRHPRQPVMQVLELPLSQHPYFIGTQFHPELTGRPLRPDPMFMGLLAAAARHAHPDIPAHQISARWLPEAGHPANAVDPTTP